MVEWQTYKGGGKEGQEDRWHYLAGSLMVQVGVKFPNSAINCTPQLLPVNQRKQTGYNSSNYEPVSSPTV